MEKYPRGSEYNIWTAIKQRCYNKHAYGYKYYGEKGVTVQEDWVEMTSLFKGITTLVHALHYLQSVK